MKTAFFAAGALALSLVSAAVADTVTAGGVEIQDAYAFTTPPKGKNGAAYMVITNTGDTADRLIDASADFARAELHKSEKTSEGAMAMIHQHDGIEIPAGESITFAPGGYHVMFMGLDSPFAEGEPRSLTLVFENAGEVSLDVDIRVRGEGQGGMHNHDMHQKGEGHDMHDKDKSHDMHHKGEGHDAHGEGKGHSN